MLTHTTEDFTPVFQLLARLGAIDFCDVRNARCQERRA